MGGAGFVSVFIFLFQEKRKTLSLLRKVFLPKPSLPKTQELGSPGWGSGLQTPGLFCHRLAGGPEAPAPVPDLFPTSLLLLDIIPCLKKFPPHGLARE